MNLKSVTKQLRCVLKQSFNKCIETVQDKATDLQRGFQQSLKVLETDISNMNLDISKMHRELQNFGNGIQRQRTSHSIGAIKRKISQIKLENLDANRENSLSSRSNNSHRYNEDHNKLSITSPMLIEATQRLNPSMNKIEEVKSESRQSMSVQSHSQDDNELPKRKKTREIMKGSLSPAGKSSRFDKFSNRFDRLSSNSRQTQFKKGHQISFEGVSQKSSISKTDQFSRQQSNPNDFLGFDSTFLDTNIKRSATTCKPSQKKVLQTGNKIQKKNTVQIKNKKQPLLTRQKSYESVFDFTEIKSYLDSKVSELKAENKELKTLIMSLLTEQRLGQELAIK